MKSESTKTNVPVKEKPFWLNFEYRVRQTGFVILLLIVFGAFLGVFSKGYFSEQRVMNKEDNLSIEYERFNRLMSDVQLKIHVKSAAGQGQKITLSGDFMANYRIDSLLPEPDNMYSHNGKLVIEYEPTIADISQTIWLSLTPLKAGAFTSLVTVNQGSELTVRQYVYP